MSSSARKKKRLQAPYQTQQERIMKLVQLFETFQLTHRIHNTKQKNHCCRRYGPKGSILLFFFFNDTANTEIYTLSLHDALPISERVRALAADIAGVQVTGNIQGYLWAKEAYGAMLAATAVSDLPIADALDDPAYRPLLTALAGQVLAQAPVRPEPLDGFDPADLDGSVRRLAEVNRGSAKTHSGIYRDLAVLHRPTEVAAVLGGLAGEDAPLVRRVLELIGAIERGERVCSRANLGLLGAYERLERLGRPLNAVAAVIGAPA